MRLSANIACKLKSPIVVITLLIGVGVGVASGNSVFSGEAVSAQILIALANRKKTTINIPKIFNFFIIFLFKILSSK